MNYGNFKDIIGYEGIYQISDRGIVKSLPRFIDYTNKFGRWQDENILRLNTSNGYKTVSLVKDKIKRTFMIHSLVASHFIDNPKNKPFVNHIDGMRWNNFVYNLEWVTNQENQLHDYYVIKRGIKFAYCRH